MTFDIIGVGSLLADIILPVEDSFLKDLGGFKGGMEYTSLENVEKWKNQFSSDLSVIPGGSAANVIRGLSQFGWKVAMISQLGNDRLSQVLEKQLKESMVSLVGERVEAQSGQVFSFVTPDGQRTMRTWLNSTFWDLKSLDPAVFSKTRLIHIESYLLSQSQFVSGVVHLAKQQGTLISLDLSSVEVVRAYRDTLLSLLENAVDLVFSNEDEARELTGLSSKEACRELNMICPTVVVTRGAAGCYVAHKGNQYECPALPVIPKDTTGAGDLFTCGFLHRFLQEAEMVECAEAGAILGSAIVQTVGSSLSPQAWMLIKEKLR